MSHISTIDHDKVYALLRQRKMMQSFIDPRVKEKPL